MKNIFVNLDNDISTKSILLITEDLEYINHLRDSSNIKYDLIKFDKKNNQLLSNLLFDYDVIIYDNKKNDLIEFITAFRISYLNNFNIPIIILDDELSFDLSNDKFSNVFTVLPRDINKKRFLLNIVGTQRIWPPRAFTLGQLTHHDLASVRIAKRATKSL